VIACDLQDGMLEKLRAKIAGSRFEKVICDGRLRSACVWKHSFCARQFTKKQSSGN